MNTSWRIRPARAGDAVHVAEIYAPVVLDTIISFETEPPSAAEMRERIEFCNRTHAWLVCVDAADVPRAYVCCGPHRKREGYQWTCETSVYVHSDFQRRGLARILYRALDVCMLRQGFYQALAGIGLPNPGSQALHRAAGYSKFALFEHVGFKFDRWVATEWWRKELRPFESTPAVKPPAPVGMNSLIERGVNFDDLFANVFNSPERAS